MKLACREYKKFDEIRDLVPQNNFVSQKDLIPGLKDQDHKMPIPVPTKDSNVEKLAQKRAPIFLH